MNLLVLTPVIPFPPHDGDKLRLYHFLRYLKAKRHVIDLCCLTRVKSDLARASELKPLCRNLYVEEITDKDLFFNLLGGPLMMRSLNIASHFSPTLRDHLKSYWNGQEGRAIDVVLAHRLRMAPAAFEGNPGKPVVLELTDCLASYAEQLKGRREIPLSRKLSAFLDSRILRREEPEWGERSFKTVVISESAAQSLRENGLAGDKILVIPNGAEPDRQVPGHKPGIYPPGKPVVCFVGNMGYGPNEEGALWFLREVWPLVKAKVPAAIFAAVGGNPRACLSGYHNERDVFVTGWVPEVGSYLKHSSVSIAPLRVAAGMQNKVALSMALGVPVVSTPTALAWMPSQGRRFVMEAAGEDSFALAVADVLLMPRKAKALAAKGKTYILKNYRWAEFGRKLENVLKEAAKKGGVSV